MQTSAESLYLDRKVFAFIMDKNGGLGRRTWKRRESAKGGSALQWKVLEENFECVDKGGENRTLS